MNDRLYVWRAPNMAFEETKLVSIIKHDGISIMICEYFATARTGKPVLVHITLYYVRYGKLGLTRG